MPNSINDSNNVTWGDDKMNNMTAAIVSAAMQNPALVGAAGLGGNLLGGLFGVEGLGQIGAWCSCSMQLKVVYRKELVNS